MGYEIGEVCPSAPLTLAVLQVIISQGYTAEKYRYKDLEIHEETPTEDFRTVYLHVLWGNPR